MDEGRATESPRLRRRRVELPSGIALDGAEVGDVGAPALVMLHGVTDSWRSFEGVMQRLPRGLRAIAITQRGHGGSDKPASGYRTVDFAADVIDAADALGLERFALLGHSMGATNAMRVAIDHPERVSALMLAGAFARYRGNAVVEEFWREVVSGLTDPIDPGLARAFQEGTLARPMESAFLEMVTAESLKAPARVWRQCFEGFMEDDVADELGAVRAPTLLLWGAHDAFSGRGDQDALRRAIRGSRLSVYEHAGHGLHWEEPERFAEEIGAFAQRRADRDGAPAAGPPLK